MAQLTDPVDVLQASLGESLKELRLKRNVDQRSLAAQAGISVNALKNIENGSGSNLRSFISLLLALGREDWLKTITPLPTINPLTLTRDAQQRQRARKKIDHG
ncbi:MAG: helix-turn-helix transcriptional regulator [Fibrobacteres bacterium]|nr:helix-turn-helix transcriptional regulator [Fibrobacterota bacterium]